MTDRQFQDLMYQLSEIKQLLVKQNDILEKQQPTNTSTKITVVGNKTQQNTKGLNSTEDFYL
jgi:hypothetical protein